MKITYTGRQVELAPAQLKKIEAQFAKVGKLLDGREEKEAHVILSLERHLHQAEITVNYYNHQLVGIASNVDPITAIHSAIEKLEKQTIKVRAKWRDTKRTPRKEEAAAAPEPAAEPEEPEIQRHINLALVSMAEVLERAWLERADVSFSSCQSRTASSRLLAAASCSSTCP